MRSSSLAESAGRVLVQEINPTTQEGWNILLQSHPEATFFHTAEWARVLSMTYGHKPLYLAATEDGQLCGLLGLVEVSSPITGVRGVSLAFTDTSSPLTSARVGAQALMEKVLALGKNRQWKYWESRGWPCEETQVTPSLVFCGHVLDLSPGEKALYDGLQSEVRTAIRKAEKAGVKIEIQCTESAMATYYKLHCLTRHRHGLPPQPYSFFQNIYEIALAKGMGFVALARCGGEPIAAAVFLHFARKAIYKFGASDKAFQKIRPNSLLMWEAIKHLTRAGFASLDFGRSSVAEEGLCRFKRSFGAVENKIHYVKYDFARHGFVQDSDKAEGWHNHVFRAMPSPVARLAGSFLYPHLS
jgi:hypothetical protein